MAEELDSRRVVGAEVGEIMVVGISYRALEALVRTFPFALRKIKSHWRVRKDGTCYLTGILKKPLCCPEKTL